MTADGEKILSNAFFKKTNILFECVLLSAGQTESSRFFASFEGSDLVGDAVRLKPIDKINAGR